MQRDAEKIQDRVQQHAVLGKEKITMEWFDKLFKKKPNNSKIAPNLSGFSPMYAQNGTNIYASDSVQQALKCIADEIKKLNPKHIRYQDNDPVPIKASTVQTVLDDPNPLMTTSEFLEKCTWLLLLNYNLFIVPIFYTWTDKSGNEKIERRYYEALYPLNPTQVNFIEDESGRLFCQFWFMSGYQTTLPYENLIHIKYNYSVNQYMGGDEFGQPDQQALKETLRLNETLLKGVAKAMKASYSVNGIVKYNTLIDGDSMVNNIRELERKLQDSESGLLPLDLKGEFIPMNRNAQIVDENTLKFVDEKILRNFGVPLAILTGDYTKSQYEAFYQKTLEPLIKSYSQALTKKLFTKRERAFGNVIELYPEDLIFMTTDQKIEMLNLLSPTGAIFENEKRTTFGLAPLPELAGKRYMSLNWVSADIASQYQLGKVGDVNIDIVDEEKEEI